MLVALERNCAEHGIRLFDPASGQQGIVHVIGPELGLTQPGMTIACGDSHTSTHGAFGAVAFGIGTSQVRDVLATQCLALPRPKVRRIEVTGKLPAGVYAKDVILAIIRQLGVNGGVGYAYEYAGPVIEAMTMEERLTVCNMSIEGGARCGYVNPDEATIAYLADGRSRRRARTSSARRQAGGRWRATPDAAFDDRVEIDGRRLAPTVTWGINPGQSVGVDERLPEPAPRRHGPARLARGGLRLHGPAARRADRGHPDRRRLHRLLHERPHLGSARGGARRAQGPGRAARAGARRAGLAGRRAPGGEAEGLDEVFRAAGFEWREAGCSMCLAMNPDKLVGREVCASSSNRNFKGRQGSPTGRTLLMTPAMVAAAALRGQVSDVRELL